jgi:hypothetical protein
MWQDILVVNHHFGNITKLTKEETLTMREEWWVSKKTQSPS